MNGAVFLDRDNTIIHNDGDLGDPSQVRLIQGAASAIASLKGLNYRIIVVTNQGGVARGKFTEADVDRVNERINELIRANSGVFIDRFYYCPYHPDGTVDRYRRDHPWRKPRPGMLLQAARDLGLDLRQSWMIGDQMRDVQAGFSAGVVPILLAAEGATPAPTKALPPGVTLPPEDRAAMAKMVAIEPVQDYFVVRSLIEAVRLIGQKSRPTNVTAAIKTERIEVVTKPQPRAAVASFEPAVAAPVIEPLEQAAVVVNEAATEAAVAQNEPAPHDAIEASAATRRKSRVSPPRSAPPKRKPAKSDADSSHTEDAPIARDVSADTPSATPSNPETPSARRESTAVSAPPIEAPAPPASTSTVKSTRITESQTTHEPVVTSRIPVTESMTTAATTNAKSDISPTKSEPALPADQTLRQILQELRSQRKVTGEFTYAGVMAIVLQMVAGVCLLAGLLMGSGDDGLFLRWIAVAVLLQLATLAMLLFRRT